MKAAILITALFLFVAAPVDAQKEPECAETDIHKSLAARLSLRRDCSLEAAVLEDVTCVGGWGDSIHRDVDRHDVTVYYCTGGPSPVAWPPALAAANCKQIHEPVGQGSLSIDSNCHVQVDLKLYDCVFNCGWQTIISNDHVTVRQYTQNNSDETKPCQDGSAGFWGAQVDTRDDCTADVGIIDAYRVCPAGTEPTVFPVTFGGNRILVGTCTLN